MNILDYEHPILVVISMLIYAIIFGVIVGITSVRVKPGSSEDFKQGISIGMVLLIGGVILYGVLFWIEDCFTDMRENAAYEEDVRQRNLIERNKASELEKLNTAPKEYAVLLNGVKTDNIVYWEDYLRDIDHVTVYIDDNRKIVRITTEQ